MTPHHAGQGPLHAGHDHHRVCRADGGQVRQQALGAGHAHVEDLGHLSAGPGGGLDGLFGHDQVAGPGRHDGHLARLDPPLAHPS